MKGKSEAKMSMLKELSKAMSDDAHSPMGEALKGKKMQKVTVMSDSKKGLKEGLSKAEEIMKMKDMQKESSEEPEMEESEEESEVKDAMEETEEMSKEELMAMMEMIKAKLEKLS